MKRYVCAVLAALLVLCSTNARALAASLEISAESAVLYDPVLGVIVFEKNAHERRAMASTTKIATALIALELYDTAMPIEIKPEWCGVEGSSFYLKPGEKMTVEDLLYGLLLASGNDAALAIASIYSGDKRDFVALMNKKAEALGLTNTRFENPSGLSEENHYSTAYEMAVLTAYAMENPIFAKIVATRSIERAGRYLSNHNKLLKTLDGAVGVKTGYTKNAGRCLVSACKRQGRTLIAVTLGAPNDWRDHDYLYDLGFAQTSEREIIHSGVIGVANLANALKQNAALRVDQSVVLSLTDAEMECIKIRLYGPRIHYGKALEGEIWGRAAVFYNNKKIAELPVFFAESVEELPQEPGFFMRFLYKIWDNLVNK